MTLARFLGGILLALMMFVPLGFGVFSARRRLLPDFRGPIAALVDVVLGLTAVTVVSEALGTFGWFHLLPLVLVHAVGGGIAWVVLRQRLSRTAIAAEHVRPRLRATETHRWSVVGTGAGVLLVMGSWLARTISAIDHGITTVDSLWYHLPGSVDFVQSGRLTSIRILDGDSVTSYFPLTSSVYHAVGYLLFGSDLVSTVVNLGWLGLALFAGWCIGRPFGASSATILGVAILLGMPGVVETQPGGALTDVVGLALLLTVVALAVEINTMRTGGLIVYLPVGLALGLVTGMKFTFIAPAGLLALGISAAARPGSRARSLAVIVVSATLSGGYWYVRNIVATGNPLPSLAVSIGPLRLPSVPGSIPQSSVRMLVLNGSAWGEHLIPGFRDAFGPAWIVILAASFAGMGTAVWQRKDRLLRSLGLVAVGGIVVFLFTPQYLFGGYFFATNLRYALPGLMVGLVLLPMAVRKRGVWVLGALLLTLVLTQMDRIAWGFGVGTGSFFEPPSRPAAVRAALFTVFVGVATPVIVLAWRRTPASRIRLLGASATVPLLVLGGLAAVHNRYVERRYVGVEPFPAAYAWVRGVHDADIAVFGQLMSLKYGFAGADWSNRVRFVSVREPDGSVRPPADCEEWRRLLAEGRFDFVLVNSGQGEVDEAAWTERIPGVRRLISAPPGPVSVQVFRLPDGLRRGPCRAQFAIDSPP